MCKIIAITNRHLCWQAYETQIETLCQNGVDAIIVREKDLNEEQYNKLFQKVKKYAILIKFCVLPIPFHKMIVQTYICLYLCFEI